MEKGEEAAKLLYTYSYCTYCKISCCVLTKLCLIDKMTKGHLIDSDAYTRSQICYRSCPRDRYLIDRDPYACVDQNWAIFCATADIMSRVMQLVYFAR